MQRERRNIVRIEAQLVSFTDYSISYFLDVNRLILPRNNISSSHVNNYDDDNHYNNNNCVIMSDICAMDHR